MVKETDHSKLIETLQELRSGLGPRLMTKMQTEFEKLATEQGSPSVKRLFKKFAPDTYERVIRISSVIPYRNRVARYLFLRILGHPDCPVKTCPKCSKKFVLPTAYCCRNCAASGGCQSEEAKAKRRKTVLKRYGVTTVVNSPEVKAAKLKRGIAEHGSLGAYRASKAKEFQQRILKKYGVLNQSQSGKLQEEIRQKRLREYGGLDAFWSKVTSRREATLRTRFGVRNYAQASDFREKRDATLIEKHGSLAAAVKKQQASYRATSLKNNGTEYPNQNLSVFLRGKSRNRAKFRQLRLKDGSELRLQGNAEFKIASLLNERGYLIGDITSGLDYSFQGKRSYYFPDFYVVNPGTGLVEVVEVKSPYTLLLHEERNYCKFKAANAWCAKNGMKFSLVVLKSNGSLVKIPWPTKTSVTNLI